jgi:acetolactate synthase I/II/III large subunit
MTVADLIIEGLLRAGVARIFGAPGGGSAIDLMAAAQRRQLPFISCRRPAAACLMAAATGELTGHPGVAVVGVGPSVAASVTGLAHARGDRLPMLFLTDRHPDPRVLDSHRPLDHAAFLGSLTKGSVTVGPESVSHWVAHAVRLALAEPRGPVHLDLPAGVGGRPAVPAAVAMTAPALPAPPAAALDGATRLIARAGRPVVVAGLQCRPDDGKWLRAFCEALPAPAITTLKGKGVMPDPHPLCLGSIAVGAPPAPVLERADLVIAFGVEPGELPPRPWPGAAPVLSLARYAGGDPGLATTGVVAFEPVLEVVGDLGSILGELAPRLRHGTATDWDVAEIDRLRRERRTAMAGSGSGLTPPRVVQIVRQMTQAGTIATADAAAVVLAAVAGWDAIEPGELLVSSAFRADGFALPGAIAAQLTHADRQVIGFTDADGFLAAAGDLDTAVELRLPIAVVVLDDGGRPRVDLAALARALGVEGRPAATEGELRAALVEALARPLPGVIAVRRV